MFLLCFDAFVQQTNENRKTEPTKTEKQNYSVKIAAALWSMQLVVALSYAVHCTVHRSYIKINSHCCLMDVGEKRRRFNEQFLNYTQFNTIE